MTLKSSSDMIKIIQMGGVLCCAEKQTDEKPDAGSKIRGKGRDEEDSDDEFTDMKGYKMAERANDK